MVHYTNSSMIYRTIFGQIFRMICDDLGKPLGIYHAKVVKRKNHVFWISCINGAIKFNPYPDDDHHGIIPIEERFNVFKASANLKYIRQKIEEWEYNVHNRTNVLAAEFPPVVWQYFIKKYYNKGFESDSCSLACKYASKKHKEPKHIDAKFYKFFTAYYSQKLLIEGF